MRAGLSGSLLVLVGHVFDCNSNAFVSAGTQLEAGYTHPHQSAGAAGEICLFGYANHNADRLTQQITQFHCAFDTHSRPASQLGIDAKQRRQEAVINNQLDDEHNKNENRNRRQRNATQRISCRNTLET